MVESIGAKPLTGGDRSVRVASVASTTPAQSPVRTPADTPVQAPAQTLAQAPRSPADTPSATSSIGIARAMASQAPVDQARVAEIKKAIANGTFPILPATIADRLLALKLEWHTDEKA